MNSGATAACTARVFLTNQAFPSEAGEVPARSLALVPSRSLDGGLHEQFAITNYGRTSLSLSRKIVVRSDFADFFEVRSGRIIRRGRIASE